MGTLSEIDWCLGQVVGNDPRPYQGERLITNREIGDAKIKLQAIKAMFNNHPMNTIAEVAQALIDLSDILDSLLTDQAQANAAPHGSMR